MPTLAVIDGFRFFFWSLDLGEPPHVHVEGHGGKAKFWLSPVELQSSRGYNERQLNKIQRIIEQHAAEWLKVWHEHFG
jgi:hypothetical protein